MVNNREKTPEEEPQRIPATTEQTGEDIPPAKPARPVVNECTEDELSAGEETIAEHVATGVPTDATVAGAKECQSVTQGHGEEDPEQSEATDDI